MGCGFFVSRTLAFTVSHNIRLNGLTAGFCGRTLGGSEFQFDIVEDLAEDDFMILKARARESTSCFNVTAGSQCAKLLGPNSMALLGCGIAMSDITCTAGGPPTLGVSLTITSASVCHVGSSNKHFGYTASTYGGDPGACLFFSPDGCVVGIHQEGVNRAKELAEQEDSLGGARGGGAPALRGIRGELAAVADSVKSIIQSMTTGGIGLYLGSAVVQAAFQRAKALEEGGRASAIGDIVSSYNYKLGLLQ